MTSVDCLPHTETMMTLAEAVALYDSTDSRAGLIQAGKEAAKWRREGPSATAFVLRALHDDHGMSYREIEQETGIPDATAERLIRRLREGTL